MKFSIKACVFSLILLVGLAGWGSRAQAEPQGRFSEQEVWMGIYYKGNKLGFSHHILRESPDKVEAKSRAYFHLKVAGVEQVTSFAQQTLLTPDLRLKEFSLLEEVMGHRQKILGRLEGDKLILNESSLGYKKEKSIPFPPNAVLSSTFVLNLFREGFEVGRKGTFPVFVEPLRIFSELEYEILRKETVELAGRPTETFVIWHRIGGIEATLWITPEGIPVRELSPDGFESRNEPKDVAQDLGGEAMSISSFITLSLVKPQRKIAQSTQKKQVKFRLLNLRSPDLVPQDHRQKVLATELLDDQTYSATLLVTTEPPWVNQPAPFPLESFPDQELLSDSTEIQAEHPLIRSLAAELTKGEINSWRAAQSISAWVYRSLDKVLVDTFTAMDALREMKGECQSHTNLFAALARASGIPTKVVHGLAYSEEYGGFVYHAWPEVFVGEWRALDPTLGQKSVDATHIKLAQGEREGVLKLMEFIGKLQIQVLED